MEGSEKVTVNDMAVTPIESSGDGSQRHRHESTEIGSDFGKRKLLRCRPRRQASAVRLLLIKQHSASR